LGGGPARQDGVGQASGDANINVERLADTVPLAAIEHGNTPNCRGPLCQEGMCGLWSKEIALAASQLLHPEHRLAYGIGHPSNTGIRRVHVLDADACRLHDSSQNRVIEVQRRRMGLVDLTFRQIHCHLHLPVVQGVALLDLVVRAHALEEVHEAHRTQQGREEGYRHRGSAQTLPIYTAKYEQPAVIS